MKRNILTALATLLLATTLLHAKEDKIAKDDIPRNEKKMWMKIDAEQEKIESSLLSGDQRFLDQLDLARKKVADIMLTAEDEKKNKQAVKQLPRAWNFWKRVTAQVEIDDVNEYNLNTALGQRAPEAQQARYASASQVAAYPTVNIYNNNGTGGQTNSAPSYQPQAANYQQSRCPGENPNCEPPQSRPGYVPYQTSQGGGYVAYVDRPTAYVTFGITTGRPAKGYPVYEKGTKHQAGYYRGSAERAPSVAPRGSGGGHR